MAVYRRKGSKACRYNFWWCGTHIDESAHTTNWRTAQQIEAARKTELAMAQVGITKPKAPPTFDAAMEQFLAWSAQQHAAHPATTKRYKTASKALVAFLGKARLDQIGVEKINSFVEHRLAVKSKRTKRKLAPSAINRELACGKAMFNWFVKSEVVVKNPFSLVKFLPEPADAFTIISYEEQQQYLAAASQPLRDIATTMLETGMRPEEVYRLRRENVHLEAGYLLNPYGKTKAAKRKIPLTSTVKSVLELRLSSAKGAYVFPKLNEPDSPLPNINQAHKRAINQAGLRHFRLYDLRHTWASRAAMSGMDLVSLAALLGHSKIVLVQRYAHPTEQHQAEAMRRLEAFNAEGIAAASKAASASIQ
jgi:integrase